MSKLIILLIYRTKPSPLSYGNRAFVRLANSKSEDCQKNLSDTSITSENNLDWEKDKGKEKEIKKDDVLENDDNCNEIKLKSPRTKVIQTDRSHTPCSQKSNKSTTPNKTDSPMINQNNNLNNSRSHSQTQSNTHSHGGPGVPTHDANKIQQKEVDNEVLNYTMTQNK
jgi:hypothetical protein